MKTKILATAGATALMLGAACASAHEYSANMAIASDYVWRGISQTNEGAAIQGGVDAGFDFGGYAGVWASNVDFDAGTNENIEMDWYVGYRTDLGCGECTLDLRLTDYRYQGEPQYNFWEGQISVTWNGLTGGLAYSPQFGGDYGTRFAAPNYPNEHDDDIEQFYPFANYTYGLPGEVSLNLHAGYTNFDKHSYVDDNKTEYWEWSAGVSKEVVGFNSMAVTYYDTDVDNLYGIDADQADARVVFAISKVM